MCRNTIIVIVILALFGSSCKNEAEQALLEARRSIRIEEKELEASYDRNVKRDMRNGLEYGVIVLENNEIIRFCFLSHQQAESHTSMALFELPNGNLKFVEGYFCCEVQLPNKGQFANTNEFVTELDKINSSEP